MNDIRSHFIQTKPGVYEYKYHNGVMIYLFKILCKDNGEFDCLKSYLGPVFSNNFYSLSIYKINYPLEDESGIKLIHESDGSFDHLLEEAQNFYNKIKNEENEKEMNTAIKYNGLKFSKMVDGVCYANKTIGMLNAAYTITTIIFSGSEIKGYHACGMINNQFVFSSDIFDSPIKCEEAAQKHFVDFLMNTYRDIKKEINTSYGEINE